MKPVITPSGEDYLETILVLQKKLGMIQVQLDTTLGQYSLGLENLSKEAEEQKNIQAKIASRKQEIQQLRTYRRVSRHLGNSRPHQTSRASPPYTHPPRREPPPRRSAPGT